MIKQRELIMILLCIAALMAAAWFWVYYQPATERIAQEEQKIEEKKESQRIELEQADQRTRRHANLSEDFRLIKEEWEVAAASLPDRFSDVEVLRDIQRVIYPHTGELSLSIGNSEQRAGDELWSTTVSLNFKTSYWQFLSILYDLVNADLGNRVVSYNLSVTPLDPSDFRSMVEGSADNMPEHIVEQFIEEYRAIFLHGRTDVEIIGLHMLDVNMRVEYLSLEPGMLTLSNLRAMWAEEERERAEQS
jgi:hypothetical protein